MPAYRVAVKALCAFTAKRGDLDRRFTPAPTGSQGMAGHSLVASRRGPGFRTEVALSAEREGLEVRGRADGFAPADGRLEEFKTHRGPVERIPDNHRSLHWAQLQTYGAMLCARENLDSISLALVYLEISEQCETVIEEEWTADKLAALFHERCARFAAWASRERSHRAHRDLSLQALSFPFGALHAQQRVLAEAVYRTAARSGRVLAEAPTGVGKTLGTLFPMLKALGGGKVEKVFYLTAKSTGRAMVLDAVARLRAANPDLTLRVLDLVARDKACVQPGKECHGGSCSFAARFYDRLPAAREAAAGVQVLDQTAVRGIAADHGVCPYYLAQEMIRWADLVVADYNHYFDSSAMLHALVRENEWEVGVLVDEAHNLVPRARQMYSARLEESALRSALADAPSVLRSTLLSVVTSWARLRRGAPVSYTALEALPEDLLKALRDAVAQLSEWTAREAAALSPAVQALHFAAMDLVRLAESFGDHSLIEWDAVESKGSSLGIRNLIPASFLASRFAAAKAIALFSATLSPEAYYRDMLGLQGECEWLAVGSPFTAEQLKVRVVSRLSTRFRDRKRSLPGVIEVVAKQFREAPGNYLLFAGSFAYLQQITQALRTRHPEIPVWIQTPGMSETERHSYASRFVEGGQGIGLAVLGGVFSEGVDLPGSRLIGAFVLTLGLPAVDPANEESRKRFESSSGRGYEYAYLYPGIQRVTQAAGRVIRNTADRGVLLLLDDRYAKPEVLDLLPAWWGLRTPAIETQLQSSPPPESPTLPSSQL